MEKLLCFDAPSISEVSKIGPGISLIPATNIISVLPKAFHTEINMIIGMANFTSLSRAIGSPYTRY